MKRGIYWVLFMVVLTGVLAGCGGDSGDGYGLGVFSATSVAPEIGSYSFSTEGSFAVVADSATGNSAVRFSRDGFRFDIIPIQDGAFFMEHGEIDGTDCPTDGYAISGHFVNGTLAEGRIAYATDCQVTSRQDFRAQR